MTYPLISEYVEAVRNAEDNFEKLRNLRPVTDGNGNPVMSSGNFAVVFKMRDEKNDKLYAVKCFLKDQPNRAENYRMIAEELEYVASSFLTKFQYLDKELFVDAAHADGEEFPVLLMDWVEGINLDLYIRQHLHDSYQLHLLAYQFSRLALWLMPQPFAHGDLKPDNIMVREDGTLVLIDYDGMFVPAMKGQKAREMGSPDFRHPARTEETFNEHIDDFSLASILLSLRVIAEEPALLEKCGAADRLLFSEKDYRAIHDCQLLKDIFPSECPEVNTLVGLFIIALTQSDLSNVSFRLLSLERPKEPEIEIIGTEVTEEDKKDAWTDEFGVKYSKDGKKLLRNTNWHLTSYTIRQGTRSICDHAFGGCISLQSVTIPDSVTSIGNSAFSSCDSLQSVCQHPQLRDQHWRPCVCGLRFLAVRHHPRLRDQHWRLGVCGLLILAVRHHPRLSDQHRQQRVFVLQILAVRHHPRLRDQHWQQCVFKLRLLAVSLSTSPTP